MYLNLNALSHRAAVSLHFSCQMIKNSGVLAFNLPLSLFFQHLSETFGVHPGDGELFINGLHIDLDIHNPFRWDSCRREQQVVRALARKPQINGFALLQQDQFFLQYKTTSPQTIYTCYFVLAAFWTASEKRLGSWRGFKTLALKENIRASCCTYL